MGEEIKGRNFMKHYFIVEEGKLVFEKFDDEIIKFRQHLDSENPVLREKETELGFTLYGIEISIKFKEPYAE